MSPRAKAWLCLAALLLILAVPALHALETDGDHGHQEEECALCQAIVHAQGPVEPVRPVVEVPAPVPTVRFSAVEHAPSLSCTDRVSFPPRGPPASLPV